MHELFPYQHRGRDWLARQEGLGTHQRTGLHDEPGVGKTGQTIAALDKLELWRGIIVGPTAIRINWPREFKAFSPWKRLIAVARNFNDFLAWQRGHWHVLILSYEQATSWARYIHDRCETYQFLIIDEAHFLKNEDAKRTKQILGSTIGIGIERWAEWGFMLTGTPYPNDPSDCFTQLKFVKELPATMSRKAFLREYFDVAREGEYGNRYRCKPERLGELQDMIARNFLRRTAAEAGLEMPPLFINQYLVEGDTRPILDLLRSHPGLDKRILQAAEHGSIARVGEEDHMMTMRRLIGEAKAVPYGHMIADELTSSTRTEKLVVFGIHREALAKCRQIVWERGGIQAVTIDGTNSAHQREQLERAYMNDDNVRVCFANIKAGGTVLTLTAGNQIDMLETDWVPDNNFQAIKRVHRISQTQAVRCRVITLAGSFDERVQEIVAEKIRNKAPLEAARAG